MRHYLVRCGAVLALLMAGVSPLATVFAANPSLDERAAAEHFEKKIRPLLAQHCYECHAHDKAGDSGQLSVDSREALLKGGDRGPIVVAGKPDVSLLIKAIKYGDPKLQMPPEGKLPDAEIELLAQWITDGAFVPEYGIAAQKKGREIDWNAARQFWSVRPLERVPVPDLSGGEMRNAEFGVRNDRADKAGDAASAAASLRIPHSAFRNPLDSFIVAKLHENGLAPSPAADKRTLIRRVSFDLIGLPPSPADVAEFLADERPDAYERLVDRLLASPHFGERWARYWLDLARYVDDTPDWQKTTEEAWLYRDWVVRAFNEDRPYDEFVKLQLAADVLDQRSRPKENKALLREGEAPAEPQSSLTLNNAAAPQERRPPAAPDVGVTPEDYAALGFVGLSPQYWKELRLAPSVIEVIVADEWDERLDAVSRTFLGLTVACARCHDHKFDAITTRDYYALAGVFASTDLSDRPLLPGPRAELLRAARRIGDELRDRLKRSPNRQVEEAQLLQQQLVDLRELTPDFDVPMAATIEEASVFVLPDGTDATKLDIRKRQPRDLPVFRRGNPGNPGEIVPRRFLELFSSADTQPFRDGSGRREFAEALFHEARPLTARVIVNRIWSHHFGRGLVRTPSDFGIQGERPSHPELLDWLSGELAFGSGVGSGFVRSPPSSGERARVRGPNFDDAPQLQTAEERTPHPNPLPTTEAAVPEARGEGMEKEKPLTLTLSPQSRGEGTGAWSLKRLHRLIVTSATYRQQSSPPATPHSALRTPHSLDPDNHLLWRANRRRLEIEPWRDAMLDVAGVLNDSLGGKAVEFDAASNRRRTLYGKVGREEQPDLLKLFDFPPPTNHSPARDVTTTPLQQLFVLNSTFVETQAAAITVTFEVKPEATTAERITAIYQRLFQRTPTATELRVGEAFLSQSTPERWRSYVKSLLGLNEFLFVD